MSVNMNDPSRVQGTSVSVSAADTIVVPVTDGTSFPFTLNDGEVLEVRKIVLGTPTVLATGTVPSGRTWSVAAMIQIQQTPPVV
jgi:CxxC motif-containing protein